MSTIKVNKIENTSTTDGGISIDNSGHVTVDGQQLPSTGALSNRNLVINGAMHVSQRATSVTSVTVPGYYTVDRFKFEAATLGTWTLTQESNGPDGFANSFKMSCTTADASPATADYCVVSQSIEAQNLQHLKYGTSSAEALTLSFYVKSNKTGTASVNLIQIDNSDKLYSAQYTINSANTWERKTISVPADTAGVINNDTGSGMQLSWWLNSGPVYTGGSFGGWSAYNTTNRNVSNLGVGGAVNDYFQITGVQLEVGSVATPFEHRSYGDELTRCHRYFQNIRIPSNSYGAQCSNSNAFYGAPIPFITLMRVTPSSITYTKENGNDYWVEVATKAVAGAGTTGLTFTAQSNQGTAMAQARISGGATPTRDSYYVWEPGFTLSINAEL